MTAGVEIVDGSTVPHRTVLDVLSQGYGRTFTEEWFRWKHLESPWGPSRCYLASDEDGPLGVVFGQPWPLRREGALVPAARLVDGATVPRAVRRGVFRAVVAAELERWSTDMHPGIVIATATAEARAAHLKNGATALEPVSFSYRPASWSRAALDRGPHVLDGFARAPDPGLATAWTADALHWRLDPRSGHDYTVSRLAQADVSHGVVHRTVGGRLRTLVVAARWGDAAACRRTIASAARRAQAVAVLEPCGPGARIAQPRLALRRGSSLLCVWDRSTDPTHLATRRDTWSLDALDLEGVI